MAKSNKLPAKKGAKEDLVPTEMLSHLLRRAHFSAEAQFATSVGKPFGLTSRQMVSLVAVAQNPGATQKDVAEFIALDANTTSDLISRMIRKGYLKLQKSDEDRRSNILFVTKAGEKVLKQAAVDNPGYQKDLAENLTVKENKELSRLLRKMLEL